MNICAHMVYTLEEVLMQLYNISLGSLKHLQGQ